MAGGAPQFQWSQVPIASSVSVAIRSLASRGRDLYAISDSRALFAADGGTFTLLTSNTSGFRSVVTTPSGAVLLLARTQSLLCTASDCSAGTAFGVIPRGDTFETFEGGCARGETLFAVGTGRDGSQGFLRELNTTRTEWLSRSVDLGIDFPTTCVATPTEVLVLGRDGVARYEPMATTVEPVDYGGQEPAYWADFAVDSAGEGLMVGAVSASFLTTGLRSAKRDALLRRWTSHPYTMANRQLRAIARLGPGEFLAGGDDSSNTVIYRWTGTTWVPNPTQPPSMRVFSRLVLGPDEVYFGGEIQGVGPAVFRGLLR